MRAGGACLWGARPLVGNGKACQTPDDDRHLSRLPKYFYIDRDIRIFITRPGNMRQPSQPASFQAGAIHSAEDRAIPKDMKGNRYGETTAIIRKQGQLSQGRIHHHSAQTSSLQTIRGAAESAGVVAARLLSSCRKAILGDWRLATVNVRTTSGVLSDWLRGRDPKLTREEFTARWCHRNVLCAVGEGPDAQLSIPWSAQHPVPLPA
ncbi:hypothetical protein COCOBI_03-4350 [Coccomyxa sp. Obi]|nr:hypothetical protein COCOBI_03-4350 [Coccomyxa sp. Obi]